MLENIELLAWATKVGLTYFLKFLIFVMVVAVFSMLETKKAFPAH